MKKQTKIKRPRYNPAVCKVHLDGTLEFNEKIKLPKKPQDPYLIIEGKKMKISTSKAKELMRQGVNVHY